MASLPEPNNSLQPSPRYLRLAILIRYLNMSAAMARFEVRIIRSGFSCKLSSIPLGVDHLPLARLYPQWPSPDHSEARRQHQNHQSLPQSSPSSWPSMPTNSSSLPLASHQRPPSEVTLVSLVHRHLCRTPICSAALFPLAIVATHTQRKNQRPPRESKSVRAAGKNIPNPILEFGIS